MAKRARCPKKTTPAKKKPAPKKPVKKRKTAKKKPRRKSAKRHPPNPEQLPEVPNRKVDDLAVQIDIWTAYEKCRSMKMTAQITGHAEQIVREVLRMDHERLRVVLGDFLEDVVEAWELKEQQAHVIMDDLLELYRGLLLEISEATRQGRATRIMDQDGYPLPVPNALQLVVASKMFDQAVRMGQVARGISDNYRNRGKAPGSDGQLGDGEGNDPMQWGDIKLAQALRDAGVPMPKILERKVRRLLPPAQ